MSELKIPEAAWRAAEAGANEVWKDYTDIAPAYKTQEGAIKAAAPLIVQARDESIEDRTFLRACVGMLTSRIDELDPQGLTKE